MINALFRVLSLIYSYNQSLINHKVLFVHGNLDENLLEPLFLNIIIKNKIII